MKKIFTLAAVAAFTLCANAQTASEKWSATKATTNEEGAVVYVPVEGYETLGEAGQPSIVKIECEHFTGEHVSGPVAGYIDGETLPLEQNVDNSWSKPNVQALSKDGSVPPLVYMQGKGNPVNLDLITFEEVTTDGEPTGRYRANWDASYYKADGSAGGPKNGTYVSITPKVDGTMKVGVWVNKGNRNIYVCDNVDYKAKTYGTDVKISGYAQALTWTDEETTDENLIGYMKFLDELSVKGTEGDEAYIIDNPKGNRPVWVYLTFDVKADVTYYVFNHNTQVGLMDVEFTYSAEDTAISNIEVSKANGVAFNLAGQKVSDNFKGVVVKNGKKVMVK